MLPAGRPQMSAADVLRVVAARGLRLPAILGVRGYYLDSMGKLGANDRGIYDDAMFVIRPDKSIGRYNASTDPSIYRKRIASLNTGVWQYETGFHGITRGNPYPALRQSGRVVVTRDGFGQDDGFFAINIHRGGVNTTSSEGCQTIPPSQWSAFIDDVYKALGVPVGVAGARAKAKIQYCLVTHQEVEQILGKGL